MKFLLRVFWCRYMNMKRLILILFCCVPMMVQAAKYNPFNPSHKTEGPVKTVATMWRAGGNVSLYYGKNRVGKAQQMEYVDELGRKTKSETIHQGEKPEHYTLITYDDSLFVSISRSYDKKGKPNDYYEVTVYNEHWLPVCEQQYHKDTIQYTDSLVYNQWGKVATVYHSHGRAPYHLSEAYKYDSIGNLLGMRSFDDKGKMEGGYEVQYTDSVVQLHYFGKSSYSWYRDKSDDGPDSWTAKYVYNEQHQLIREESLKRTSLFTQYDEYGNWLVCETHDFYGLNEYVHTTIREFTYWESEEP